MTRLRLLLTAMLILAASWPIYAQEIPIETEELGPPQSPHLEIVGFERQRFTVQRVRGKVFIDTVESADDVVERDTLEMQLIRAFDGLAFSDTREFRSWVKQLRGKRTYTFDNVFLNQPDGTIVTTPLVLLPPQQRAIADVQWQAWLAQQQALVVQKQEIEQRRQAQRAERERIEALQALVQQQAASANRLANLEERIARNARRRFFFFPQVTVATTGTGLSFGQNGVGFVSSNLSSQSTFGFPIQGSTFGVNP